MRNSYGHGLNMGIPPPVPERRRVPGNVWTRRVALIGGLNAWD